MKGWHAMHSKSWKQTTSQGSCWAPAPPRASPAGCGGSMCCPHCPPQGQWWQEHSWAFLPCYYCNSFTPVDPNPGSKPGRQRHNRRNHVWRGQQEPHPPHRQTHLHPDSTSGKEGLRSSLCDLGFAVPLPHTSNHTSDHLRHLDAPKLSIFFRDFFLSQVWSFLAVHSLSMWSLSAAAHSPSLVLYQQ